MNPSPLIAKFPFVNLQRLCAKLIMPKVVDASDPVYSWYTTVITQKPAESRDHSALQIKNEPDAIE